MNDWYPGLFSYTGNGSFKMSGKSPDFVSTSTRKIIELFGDYWHADETVKSVSDRVNLFKSYGYNTLIVWESEFKNIAQLRSKIERFMNA